MNWTVLLIGAAMFLTEATPLEAQAEGERSNWPTDLRRKLMSYIRPHNRDCRPFNWTYRNSQNRIRVHTS